MREGGCSGGMGNPGGERADKGAQRGAQPWDQGGSIRDLQLESRIASIDVSGMAMCGRDASEEGSRHARSAGRKQHRIRGGMSAHELASERRLVCISLPARHGSCALMKLCSSLPPARAGVSTTKAIAAPARVLDRGRAAGASRRWEYERAETPEAQLCKDFDKLEMIIQASEYERLRGAQLQEFFDSTRDIWRTDIGCVRAHRRRNAR